MQHRIQFHVFLIVLTQYKMFYIYLLISLIIKTLPLQTIQSEKLEIPFYENTPLIDGLPDDKMNSVNWKSFNYVWQTDTTCPVNKIRYKMAYSFDYLYIIVESDANSITVRDRAYQNGDGMHIVIANAGLPGPTDEFYVLRFSPADKSRNLPARKGIWYYNKDLSGRSLSAGTQFVCSSFDGKSYFELLLPWTEVYPYSPFALNSIGINACFVKASGESGKNYYLLKQDDLIQSELSPRKFISVSFDKPENRSLPFINIIPDRNNITAGDFLQAKVVSVNCSQSKYSFHFTLNDKDKLNRYDKWDSISVPAGNGITKMVIPSHNLEEGTYSLNWECKGISAGEIQFTVLPEMNRVKDSINLGELKDQMSMGDFNTLLFSSRNLFGEKERLKSYETGDDFLKRYLLYKKCIIKMKKNHAAISDSTGIFRRAFVSQIDMTFQPYSIHVPENFDRNKKYPLLVMLHGSGADDREILNNPLTRQDCILIAPYGRGTSNCFTTDGAEIDVHEAITDVIKNYPIDTSRILIAGFSMGGYGACRIFYEYPHLFRGVIIFSGHPSLATKWIGDGYPDFLNPLFLKPFANIPVFIFHSKNDLNCPYTLMKEFADKLINIGAEVQFVTSRDAGHRLINDENLGTYFEWQEKILGTNSKQVLN